MRYRIEYALFLSLGLVVRMLPLEAASAFIGALWRMAAPFSKRHRRALSHLKIAFPDSTEAERRRIANEMWDTMGRIFAESYRLKEIAFSDCVVLEDPEAARTVFEHENGFVTCAAHQGN